MPTSLGRPPDVQPSEETNRSSLRTKNRAGIRSISVDKCENICWSRRFKTSYNRVMHIKSHLDLQCLCGAVGYTTDSILNESENKKGFSVIKGPSHRQETRRWRIRFVFLINQLQGERLWTGKSNWILKLLDSKEKDKHKEHSIGFSVASVFSQWQA